MANDYGDYCLSCSKNNSEHSRCSDCPVIELGYLSKPDAYYGSVIYYNTDTHEAIYYSYSIGNVDDADVREYCLVIKPEVAIDDLERGLKKGQGYEKNIEGIELLIKDYPHLQNHATYSKNGCSSNPIKEKKSTGTIDNNSPDTKFDVKRNMISEVKCTMCSNSNTSISREYYKWQYKLKGKIPKESYVEYENQVEFDARDAKIIRKLYKMSKSEVVKYHSINRTIFASKDEMIKMAEQLASLCTTYVSGFGTGNRDYYYKVKSTACIASTLFSYLFNPIHSDALGGVIILEPSQVPDFNWNMIKPLIGKGGISRIIVEIDDYNFEKPFPEKGGHVKGLAWDIIEDKCFMMVNRRNGSHTEREDGYPETIIDYATDFIELSESPEFAEQKARWQNAVPLDLKKREEEFGKAVASAFAGRK